jgi:histidyl-tRNA synthetase
LVLQAKGEDEIILNSQAPVFREKFLKKDSKAHYEAFKGYLDVLEVPYREDNTLVTGRAYATNSIWQFVTKDDKKLISEGYRHNIL